jgi:hypothetical protein
MQPSPAPHILSNNKVVGTAQTHYMVEYYLRNDAGLWTQYMNFPWINADTADNALYEALSYVNDRSQLGDI